MLCEHFFSHSRDLHISFTTLTYARMYVQLNLVISNSVFSKFWLSQKKFWSPVLILVLVNIICSSYVKFLCVCIWSLSKKNQVFFFSFLWWVKMFLTLIYTRIPFFRLTLCNVCGKTLCMCICNIVYQSYRFKPT